MKRIIIEGKKELTGTIKISGAKNSAVALVPASLLAEDTVTIDNIPDISDIKALNEILEYLGSQVTRNKEKMEIDPSTVENKAIPENILSKTKFMVVSYPMNPVCATAPSEFYDGGTVTGILIRKILE